MSFLLLNNAYFSCCLEKHCIVLKVKLDYYYQEGIWMKILIKETQAFLFPSFHPSLFPSLPFFVPSLLPLLRVKSEVVFKSYEYGSTL